MDRIEVVLMQGQVHTTKAASGGNSFETTYNQYAVDAKHVCHISIE
jgi:hypothetical protein